MASTRRRAPVLPRVVAAFGILVFTAGSVLVFMVPPKAKPPVKVDPIPTYSATPLSDPQVTHDLRLPKKATPPTQTAKPTPRSTPKPSASPSKLRPPVRRDPSPDPVDTPTPRPVVTPTPTPKPAPTTAKPSPTVTPTQTFRRVEDSERRAQVIYLINQQRAQAGLGQLTSSSRISDHCQEWATVLASEGRLKYSAMGAAGEVIAGGTTLPDRAVQTWLNDTYDRPILLNPNFTRVGSGYVNGYWVVQFG